MLRQRSPRHNLERQPLTPDELSLLRAVHEADLDHGGLFREELTADELDVCGRLVESGFAEVLSEFGEAPDGEEDEREAGGRYCFRITGRGVERLRDTEDERAS
jgi:hypothetical protein